MYKTSTSVGLGLGSCCFGSNALTMSFSLNDTSFPCKSEVEFKIVGSRPTGCMQLTNQKIIATYAQKNGFRKWWKVRKCNPFQIDINAESKIGKVISATMSSLSLVAYINFCNKYPFTLQFISRLKAECASASLLSSYLNSNSIKIK